MNQPILLGLQELQGSLRSEIRSEKAVLASHLAKAAISEKRLADLQYVMDSNEASIARLTMTPSPVSDPTKPGKRIPIAWGKGTRHAYIVLRDAAEPLTVPELARLTLVSSGTEQPTELQMKSMANGLYKSLQEQVAHGRIKEHATHPKTFSIVAALSSKIP